MTIWVDADACPNVIKEILYRAAERMQMPLVLVANQSLRVPPSRFIRTLRVAAGFDVADNEIVRQCEAGDLVITADIPLAAEAIEKGAAALNPRGERYTPATIRERLTISGITLTMGSFEITGMGLATIVAIILNLSFIIFDKLGLMNEKE